MFKPADISVEQIPVSASLSGTHCGSKWELLIQPTSTPPNGCELSVPLQLSLAGVFFHSLNINLCSCLVSYPNYCFREDSVPFDFRLYSPRIPIPFCKAFCIDLCLLSACRMLRSWLRKKTVCNCIINWQLPPLFLLCWLKYFNLNALKR